jgi:DNA-binding beta-propeller fold protein YncE
MLLLTPGLSYALLPHQNTGNLYVSMWSSDEIAVFSPDGTALERFSAEGLDGPRGIAFNPANGDIWVAAEFSNSLFIFDHEHQLKRRLDHEDFDEPVGITFSMDSGAELSDALVYISNSNGNEIMVFDQPGNLIRRFTGPALADPNCSAFMEDGSFFVANRLGGTQQSGGAVSKFDSGENFLFDFTTTGIASLMAVARDSNTMSSGIDDTLWATSGAGDTGIYEFDQSGNLLTVLLPADIDDGRPIVPQGIAFDDEGNFVVVSFLNEVIKFDGDGNFLMRFPTGDGTARSTAFQACRPDQGIGDTCVSFASNEGATSGADDTPDNNASENDLANMSETISGSDGSGTFGLFFLALNLVSLLLRRKF